MNLGSDCLPESSAPPDLYGLSRCQSLSEWPMWRWILDNQ